MEYYCITIDLTISDERGSSMTARHPTRSLAIGPCIRKLSTGNGHRGVVASLATRQRTQRTHPTCQRRVRLTLPKGIRGTPHVSGWHILLQAIRSGVGGTSVAVANSWHCLAVDCLWLVSDA
jgi:hypothetical protein